MRNNLIPISKTLNLINIVVRTFRTVLIISNNDNNIQNGRRIL